MTITNEAAWLIEHVESSASAPLYFIGAAPFWGYENQRAVRFTREIDAVHASEFIQHMSKGYAHGSWKKHRVCEHAWMSPCEST